MCCRRWEPGEIWRRYRWDEETIISNEFDRPVMVAGILRQSGVLHGARLAAADLALAFDMLAPGATEKLLGEPAHFTITICW